jgi:hypothetical protein
MDYEFWPRVTLRSSAGLGNFSGDPDAIPTGLYGLALLGRRFSIDEHNEP